MLKAGRIALVISLSLLCVPAFGAVSFPLADSGWAVLGPSFMDLNVVVDDVHWSEDPAESYVLIEIQKKHWVAPDENGNFSPITLTFVTNSTSEAVPNIRIADETIANFTGADWYDYHWILSKFEHASFNTDIPVYTGNPPDAPAGVWDVYPFEDYSWELGETTESLNVFTGVVPDFSVFSPGVYSNGYLEINVDLESAPERFSFDLKQLPTIPEPATLTILAMGAGAILRRRRRRD